MNPDKIERLEDIKKNEEDSFSSSLEGDCDESDDEDEKPCLVQQHENNKREDHSYLYENNGVVIYDSNSRVFK